MSPLAVLSLVLGAEWVLAAVLAAGWFRGRGAGPAGSAGRTNRQALWCLSVAGAHVVAGAVAPAALPIVLISWLGYALAFPIGRLGTVGRRLLLLSGGLALTGWSAVLFGRDGRDATPRTLTVVLVTVAISAVAGFAIALRCRRASPHRRAAIQWLTGATVMAGALDVVLLAAHVMAGIPHRPSFWLASALLLVPLGQIAGSLTRRPRLAENALIEAIVISGLAVLVVAVYLVVVVGLGHTPTGTERGILVSSLAAAVLVAALALPVRRRLTEMATALVNRQAASAEEVVATFGARMSRAVPMDELMLQLAESLRATIATAGSEVWVGTDGVLTRSVSVPGRPAARLVLGERERAVVGRARIGGPSWASVWLPEIASDPGVFAVGRDQDDGEPARVDLRVAPVAHLGDLLGLIVVRRDPGSSAFGEDEDRLLVDLARQLGLALHNVRLDSALQASLEELEQRNIDLQHSRLRIVTTADESRRAIEQNLHDGAQQHLVALAVKLGVAEQLLDDNPELVHTLLQELRSDVQTTIRELRELAHGIYPPLLRDRGLAEALRAAANRSPLSCRVEVDLADRHPPEIETATYFCCLEAMQNAGKHAGAQAQLKVAVHLDESGRQLEFAVTDDGAGFDGSGAKGHGFDNMSDRLGAIGGTLKVTSALGQGTTIGGRIPLPGPGLNVPVAAAAAAAGTVAVTAPAAGQTIGGEDVREAPDSAVAADLSPGSLTSDGRMTG
jgi:signal transduction histidine kinase